MGRKFSCAQQLSALDKSNQLAFSASILSLNMQSKSVRAGMHFCERPQLKASQQGERMSIAYN
jgi:hypothetical protein